MPEESDRMKNRLSFSARGVTGQQITAQPFSNNFYITLKSADFNIRSCCQTIILRNSLELADQNRQIKFSKNSSIVGWNNDNDKWARFFLRLQPNHYPSKPRGEGGTLMSSHFSPLWVPQRRCLFVLFFPRFIKYLDCVCSGTLYDLMYIQQQNNGGKKDIASF